MTRNTIRLASLLGVALTLSLLTTEAAEARRGGSFGSRGMRTYQMPRSTPTAPGMTGPVQRSMTAPTAGGFQPSRPAPFPAQAQAPGRRGGFLGGMGGGLLGGLIAGGLMGTLLGHGWGGLGAGFMNTLLQIGLIALVAFVLLRLFRRREPAPAAGPAFGREAYDQPPPFGGASVPLGGGTGPFGGGYAPSQPDAYGPGLEIQITPADREAFERLLREVQEAFGREDYAALRARTTPEIMSYLAEELSQNAVQGRRNAVTDVRLLQADVAEAWREGDREYATCALRYQSVDVLRDRQTGALVEGEERPTETTELWTFVREPGEAWKLSAIQEA